MAKIKKGQLEKIIQKEYINVLKEVKNNEAYFNHIAYEYVTQSLINEGWADRGWQKQVADWERDDLESGESWASARARRDMPELPGQFGAEDDATTHYGGFGQDPDVAPGTAEPVGRPGTEEDTFSLGELPEQYANELLAIAEKAPTDVGPEKIVNIGHDVFSKLEDEIGGIKTQEDIGQLVIEILDTVLNAMRKGRNWKPQVEIGKHTV